jgi:nucleotide-binding universal stress UspA family protein
VADALVCCVDDSEHAPEVVRVAARLGERLGLRLVLLHVARAPTAPGVSTARAGQERLVESERARATELLEEVARTAALGGGLKRAVLGSVSHEVASKASCVVVIVPPGVTG